MRRSADSVFTKIFARSISVHISPLLAKTSIKPLQITCIGLFLGLCAAWLAIKPSWYSCLIAALLIESSHILDCIDGELARLTNRGSPFAAFFDPISDRFKDIAIIYASCLKASKVAVFNLAQDTIFFVAFFSLAFWLLYMYIVDAYLNPSRKEDAKSNSLKNYRSYLGLYDLFIYGSIVFLIGNIFEFFNFYILVLALMGVLIQIYRLDKVLRNDDT